MTDLLSAPTTQDQRRIVILETLARLSTDHGLPLPNYIKFSQTVYEDGDENNSLTLRFADGDRDGVYGWANLLGLPIEPDHEFPSFTKTSASKASYPTRVWLDRHWVALWAVVSRNGQAVHSEQSAESRERRAAALSKIASVASGLGLPMPREIDLYESPSRSTITLQLEDGQRASMSRWADALGLTALEPYFVESDEPFLVFHAEADPALFAVNGWHAIKVKTYAHITIDGAA
jgi:hypothetical protein